MNFNNIYINPSFIPKSQSKIHLNPSFMNVLKHSLDSSQAAIVTSGHQHPQVGQHSYQETKSINNTNEKLPVINSMELSNYSNLKDFASNASKNDSFCISKPSFESNYSLVKTTSTSTSSKPSLNTCQGCSTKYSKQNLPSQNLIYQTSWKGKFCNWKSSKKSQMSTLPALTKFRMQQKNGLRKKTINPYTKDFYNSLKYKILNKSSDAKVIHAQRAKYTLDKRSVKPSADQTQSTKERLYQVRHQMPLSHRDKESGNCSISVEDDVHQLSSIVKETPQKPYLCEKDIEDNLHTTKMVKDYEIIIRSNMVAFDNSFSPNRPNSVTLNSIIVPHTANSQTSQSSKSNSTNSQTLKKNNEIYTLSSKLKLVENVGSEKFVRKKSNYAIKTKTKLIRGNKINSRFKKSNISLNTSKFKKVTPLKRGFITRDKENKLKKTFLLNLRRVSPTPDVMKLQSKYKVINKPKAAANETVKYGFIHTPNSVRTMQAQFPHASNVTSKNKRNPQKSDKFINIEGRLYKSTRTSLKKQDLTLETNKCRDALDFKVKSKKRLLQNSKFVYRRQSSNNLQSGTLIEIVRRKKLVHFKKVNDYCFFYNKYGRCKKEKKGCPFLHDPKRVAVCTRFLQGSCSVKECPFSHTFDKNKMPVCRHFVEGSCHREACPYRHVRVNPKAPLCRNFLQGHCPLGEECKKQHVLICEEFKADGACPRGKKCPLSHRKRKTSFTKKGKKNFSTFSTASAHSSPSCSKKGMAKKLPQRKSCKIGVLGLEFDEDSTFKQGVARRRGAASSGCTTLGRYFDRMEGTSSLESDQLKETGKLVAIETSEWEAQNISLSETANRIEKSTGKSSLAEKRERLRMKIEKLKRKYYIDDLTSDNVTGTSGNALQLDVKTRLMPYNGSLPECVVSAEWNDRMEQKTHLSEMNDTGLLDATHQPEASIKLRFRSLPDVLPSYIPLTLPEDTDEKN